MDITALTDAVPSTVIIAGVTALAAIKFAPTALRWGYNQVMRVIR